MSEKKLVKKDTTIEEDLAEAVAHLINCLHSEVDNLLPLMSEHTALTIAEKIANADNALKKYLNNSSCEDHTWISTDNEHSSGGEMCYTCYQNGINPVPIRSINDRS